MFAQGQRPLFDVDANVKIGIISVARKIDKKFVLDKIAALRKKGNARKICKAETAQTEILRKTRRQRLSLGDFKASRRA